MVAAPVLIPLDSEPLDIAFEETAEFGKDMERLRKKFRSIDADLETFKKALCAGGPERLPHTFPIAYLKAGAQCGKAKVFKAKKFRSRDLRSTDEMRVIFAWIACESRVVLIEIYHKGAQENEDKKRIGRHLARLLAEPATA